MQPGDADDARTGQKRYQQERDGIHGRKNCRPGPGRQLPVVQLSCGKLTEAATSIDGAYQPSHAFGMVNDISVYRTADRLIAQHGADAMQHADRLIGLALDRREDERALLMIRVRLAIRMLQAPPSRLLH
jgi:hypothetical protein